MRITPIRCSYCMVNPCACGAKEYEFDVRCPECGKRAFAIHATYSESGEPIFGFRCSNKYHGTVWAGETKLRLPLSTLIHSQ
jgi:hypothetical protein